MIGDRPNGFLRTMLASVGSSYANAVSGSRKPGSAASRIASQALRRTSTASPYNEVLQRTMAGLPGRGPGRPFFNSSRMFGSMQYAQAMRGMRRERP